MEPPLRERLRWRTAMLDGTRDPATRATMARAGAYFAAAGALAGAVSVLVPDTAVEHEVLLAATAGGAAVLALLLVGIYDRLPGWGFQLAVVAGTALATAGVYAWGTESSYAPLPYLWVALFAFYFFPLRAALAHTVLIAAGYALALGLEDSAKTPVDGWIATVGTLLLAGLFISRVRSRLVTAVAHLTDGVRRDPLTRLLNRAGLDAAFNVELERARRTDAPLSLVVADLDRFQRINDEHGQASGDDALRLVAHAIDSVKRSFDGAARIGGEEFALIAPECDEHGAYMLAERLRSEVERIFAEPPGPLTMSLGIATFPLHGQSADSLTRAAGQALHAAKRLGHNRAVISSAEVQDILARAPRGQEEGHVELAMLLSLAEALDVRDSGTASHCRRVGRFAELTARELGLSPESVERVRLAGILHDVGRVGVPDTLLSKRDPLTDEDWMWIRSHPVTGARMVETTDFDDIRSWILTHHERPDGAGYPEGVEWDEVPLEARILAVADAYEAMTSERSYRSALAPEAAAVELRREAGRQFDRRVVEALLRVV
jgi:diguanylate cyclase (GGDEF)-like protein/putative nucleotidyltransferase with HDIG domain